jgi:hypothetical protein
MASQRSALLSAFSTTGQDMKRNGGLAILRDADKEACRSFFGQLAEYGVFVVPVGEIEAWLPELEVSRNKNSWLGASRRVV